MAIWVFVMIFLNIFILFITLSRDVPQLAFYIQIMALMSVLAGVVGLYQVFWKMSRAERERKEREIEDLKKRVSLINPS